MRAASFCPFEPDAFMTAGRDSIRCWRLARARAAGAGRSGGADGDPGGDSGAGPAAGSAQIRGMSVRRTGGAGPLGGAGTANGGGCAIGGTAAPGAAAGPNIFTAIAYECGVAAGQVARRHAFVASAAGTVFQVDYDRCGHLGLRVSEPCMTSLSMCGAVNAHRVFRAREARPHPKSRSANHIAH